jgi:hypothetical protein
MRTEYTESTEKFFLAAAQRREDATVYFSRGDAAAQRREDAVIVKGCHFYSLPLFQQSPHSFTMPALLP